MYIYIASNKMDQFFFGVVVLLFYEVMERI